MCVCVCIYTHTPTRYDTVDNSITFNISFNYIIIIVFLLISSKSQKSLVMYVGKVD